MTEKATKPDKRDQVLVRCTPEMLERLDNWRRKQQDIPTRAEALRRLADHSLKLDQMRRITG